MEPRSSTTWNAAACTSGTGCGVGTPVRGRAQTALCYPSGSPFRNQRGSLNTDQDSPLMQGIVPLIAIVFLLPGLAYGYAAGTITSHRDVIKGMSKSMSTMGYYLVLAFFAAQFTWAFNGARTWALCSRFTGPRSARIAGAGADRRRHSLIDGDGQPADRLSLREVGTPGADLRAHDDGAGLLAGADPGGLSHWRFEHEHHHAAHALFSARGDVRAEDTSGARGSARWWP